MKKTQVAWLFVGLCFTAYIYCSQDADSYEEFVIVPANIVVEMYENDFNVTSAQEDLVSTMVREHLALEGLEGPAKECLDDHRLQLRFTQTMMPFFDSGERHFKQPVVFYEMASKQRDQGDMYAGIVALTLNIFFSRSGGDRLEVTRKYPCLW